MDNPEAHGEHRGRHETTDVEIKPLAIFLAGLFITIVVVLAGMVYLHRFFAARQPQPLISPSPLATAPQVPPPPRLQVAPQRDLEQLRAEEERLLTTYGWVDPQNGVVRISIDRAMDLIAERGLPAKSTTEAPR
jgi:hypothetical protein